jgi:hypothetical protein
VIARFSVHLSGAVKDEFNSENGLFAADYMPPASQSLSGGPVGSSRAPGIHTLRFSDAKEQFELRIQMSGIIAQGDYTAAVNALGVTLMVSGDSRSFNVLQSGQLTLDSVNRDQTQISGHFEFKVAPQSDPDTVVTITGAFTELPIEQVQNGATASTTVPGSDSTGS